MSDDTITVYSDAEYRGTAKTLGIGKYPTGFGLKNDSLSSLRIPHGLKVTLCEHTDFGGRRCILVRDTPHLGNVNDEATSMIVERDTNPSVIVYSDSQFRGWSATVPVGSQSAIGAGNDLVSSVIVPPGHRVTLYEHVDFKGRTLEFTEDMATLGDFNDETSSIMVDRIGVPSPTLAELEQIIAKVGPRIYLHPDEAYRPSSVEWFLERATLHSSDGARRLASSKPLPAGGGDDGKFWLEGEADARPGNLDSAVAYVNAKHQNDWLDIQFWIFYPYNGAGRASVSVREQIAGNAYSKTINLKPMGQHGGDWEHVTCRVDPGSKQLRAVYLAQHGGGEWVAKADMQLEDGRPVVFSSQNGHASYREEGSNLSNRETQNWELVKFEFGLLNSTDKGSKSLDCSRKYKLLRADFAPDSIAAPDWTNYCRRWGPQISYETNDLEDSIRSAVGDFPYSGKVVDAIWGAIPDEAKEENGPTGPWMKGPWEGGE